MVFLNGKFLPIDEAKVSVLDRGFIFGDGVYELVPVYSRVAFRLDQHLERLERSLAETRIRNPYARGEWRDIIYRLVDAQPFDDQGVYFQVTRGVAKRDHAFPKGVEPTVFMMSNPLVTPPRELVEKGAAAVSAHDNRWLRCDIKSISLIGNCLLRHLSAERAEAETILFRDGKLTEASASNVFAVRRGVLLSPPKSNLILPGITYDVVTELARANGMPLELRDVTEAEASVSLPSRKRIVSVAPASADAWRNRTLPISEIDLMSQRSQRLSTALTATAPFSTSSLGGFTSGLHIANTVGSTPAGNAWSRLATPRVTWKYTA